MHLEMRYSALQVCCCVCGLMLLHVCADIGLSLNLQILAIGSVFKGETGGDADEPFVGTVRALQVSHREA